MPAYVETFNQIVAVGVIVIQIIIITIAIALIFFRHRSNPILLFFKKYTFVFGFLIALGAVAVSLFYSEVIGFPACELCWIQRIFLYPQLILFGMELFKKERAIVDYSLVLAICGSVVSLYHMYIERGGQSLLPCAALNVTTQVSCAIRYVYEFGYVTIPIMSLTLSLFIIIILLNYKYMSKMSK